MKKLGAKLKGKKLFLLDIDGTVSFDSTLIEGAREFFDYVNENGGKYVFITNNSTKSIQAYVEKFTKMGVAVDKTSFLTSSYATAHYLKETYGDKALFLVGTNSFVEELKSFGLSVTEKKERDDIAAAVVGFDNELTYQKIFDVCELLETREVDYIATNPDLVCPVSFGFVPDCGAICGMIEKAVHREPLYIGKPNKMMIDMAMELTGYKAEETVVVGDRLYTDIASGINAEVDTVLVFTGEAKEKDLEHTEFPPTYYCESIKDIYQALSKKNC